MKHTPHVLPRPLSATLHRWMLAVALLSAMASTGLMAQNVAINTNGAAPNADALLDVNFVSGTAPYRGMLIPRMTQAQRLAIPAPVGGLLVFQTDDQVGEAHGLWYYNAAAPVGWERLAAGRAWALRGNAGSDPVTDFIGTTDATDFVWRTNNVERMRILATGEAGINTPTPTEALDVDGGMRLQGAAATNDAGAIRYNNVTTFHEGNTLGGALNWERLENAERLVLNDEYAGSVLQCGDGVANVGNTGVALNNTLGSPYPNITTGSGVRRSTVQYLYRANELVAAGLCPGLVTSVDLLSLGGNNNKPYNLDVWVVQVPAATLNVLAGNYAPGYAGPSHHFSIDVAGDGFRLHPLSTPLNWNGVDNILVTMCFTWAAEASAGLTVAGMNVGWNATHYAYDGFTGGNSCALPTGGVTPTAGLSTRRPFMRFVGQALGPVPALAFADYVNYDGGLMVGSAAWAAIPGNYKGPGSIHAERGVYDGNVQLSDHVFDLHFDGRARPEEQAQAHSYQDNYVELPALRRHLAEHRSLPTMPGRSAWADKGPPSLGELATGLWQTVETQALYIAELEERLSTLEDEAFAGGLSEGDLHALLKQVERDPHLTADEKARLQERLQRQAADAQQNRERNEP